MEIAKCKRSTLFSVMTLATFLSAVAYDPFDPYGSININWAVLSWTPDGYVAAVTISNNQMYRHITNPGWSLGWTWAKKEVIWSIVGAQSTDQGDFPNSKFTNCCKSGVLASLGQDPSGVVSAFQVGVGLLGPFNKTVTLPKNFFLLGPGPGYTCSAATIVPSTVSFSPDCRRVT